jgi:TetR/AcrR family transcriptional regulator
MNNTKNTIFEAALKVFSENGFDGATMDSIALNAGVAKGTLYYHFKSKEEIFTYIITEGMKILKDQIYEATNEEVLPIEKLKVICRIQLNMVYRNRDFFKVIMSQLWGKEVRQSELRKVMGDYIKFLEGFIKEAIDAKCIREGQATFIAYSLFGNLCSAAVYELINKDEEVLEEVEEKLIFYVFNGINIQS